MGKIKLAILLLACIASASALLSHSSALSQLQAQGITVSSSGGCSNRHNPSCTSLEQIRQNTIDGLITLKQASGCTIIVTGGTETGHGSSSTYSHWNGYKADIRLNTCINNYITRRFVYIGRRSDNARMYQSAAGNKYAKEGNHWDIVYY